MGSIGKTETQMAHEPTESHAHDTKLRKPAIRDIPADAVSEEVRRCTDNILEAVRESVLILDSMLKIISANPNFYRTFALTPDETIGTFIYDLGDRQWDLPRLRRLFEEIVPHRQTVDRFEVAHHFRGIGQKILLLSTRPLHLKGDPKMILLVIEDMTEHMKLEESHGRLVAIVESANDAIIGKDLDGVIRSWNHGAATIYGYTAEEAIGKRISLLKVPDSPDEYKEILTKMARGESIKRYETRRRRKNGQIIDVSLTISPVKDASGKIIGASTIARDITEHKRMERLLVESEERYRRLFETASDGIVLLEKSEGRIDHANPAIEKMLGYTKKESIGSRLQDIGIRLDSADYQAILQKLNNNGIINFDDVPVRTKAGRQIVTDIYLVDRANSIQGNIRDVTSRKQAEDALRDAETRYRMLFEHSPDGIVIIDPITAKPLEFNESAYKNLGYSHEEFANLTIHDIDADETPEETQSHIAKVMREGREDFDTRQLTKQSQIRDIHVTAQLTELSGHTVYHTIWRDITDRKKAEKELKTTLERLTRAVGTTVQVMAAAVEIRDPYTAGHQLRSADLARAIAVEMGLPQEKIDAIRMAGSIHDIGKLSVPAEILSKPTGLSAIEYSLVQEHARKGYEILKGVESSWPLAEIVYQHHERMNGSGYPRNLRGEEILLEARILAVSDVVESMASHRPYRPTLGIDRALNEIEVNRGILYDADVADACLKIFREKGFQLP
jgi:PAS domain S-box-containing protein